VSTDDVTSILAVLATVGAVAGIVGAVAAVLPGIGPRLQAAIAGQGVPLAWLVALVATSGSLYLSEGADFVPCRLCWFQRIAMYPLVIVLAVGWLRREAGARLTGAVLAGLGLLVNLWHVAIELRPSLEGSSCDPATPCSFRWIEVYGFWTIPRMATVAFGLVLLALALDGPLRPRPSQEVSAP
jgi:disulfide bond formation protein DsbB